MSVISNFSFFCENELSIFTEDEKERERTDFDLALTCWEKPVERSRYSYGLHDRGVGFRVPVGARLFSSARRPDRFWRLTSLQVNE
jgi:hypothetical protein